MNVNINSYGQSFKVPTFATFVACSTFIVFKLPSFHILSLPHPCPLFSKNRRDQPDSGVHCYRHHPCIVWLHPEHPAQLLLEPGQPVTHGIEYVFPFLATPGDTYSSPYMKGFTATDSLQHTAAIQM